MSDQSLSSSSRTQRASAAKMGILEKLAIFPNLIMCYMDGVVALFTRFWHGVDQLPPTLGRDFKYSLVRALCTRMSVRQLHLVSPSTDAAYLNMCKTKKKEPNTIVLKDGTTAHWIGSPTASRVIINFHGGGYCLPAGAGFFTYMDQLQQSLSKQGHSVSILFATYDLSPDAPYPRQLQQAALLLDHVLNSLHIPPENIILCGDSAGGNLALSLLSHVMHPHPSTNPQIPPLKVSGSFRGLVLVSPWVDFRTELPAYGSYRKDCLHPLALQKWSSAFLGHPYPFPREVLDEYNQPVLADEGWWVDIPVSSILIVGGRDEVLIDSIEEFGATLTRVKDRLAKEESGNGHLKEVQVFVAEGECHDQVNVDLDTGFTEPGKQAEMVRSWVAAHV